MDFAALIPNDDEQIVSLGQTGTGKSTWMKKLIIPYIERRQIIIIDSKHDDVWDGMGEIARSPNVLFKRADKFERYPVMVYRPEGDLATNYEAYDDIFAWIYWRTNTVLVVDEATQVTESPLKLRRGLSDITTRGRKKHILRIFGSQRPSGCPRVIFSESSRFYVRRVIDTRDRDVIAGFAGPCAKDPIPDRYGMKYIDIRTNECIYFPNVPK